MVDNSTVLIPASKTVTPKRKWILRHRLFDLIEKKREFPLLWIEGPQGVGKTWLFASYIQYSTIQHIWYQLDCSDFDLGNFFHYLTHVVQEKNSDQSLNLPVYKSPKDITSFCRDYFQQYFQYWPNPFLIVLDDYQNLCIDDTFNSVIKTITRLMPKHGNLTVLSRIKTPSVFSKQYAERVVGFIDESQLLFDQVETQHLVEYLLGRPGSEQCINELWKKTGGWATGIDMLIGQYGDSPVIKTPQVVFDYFEKEILGTIETARQDMLVTLAFLPRFSGELAAHLTKNIYAQKFLNELCREYRFINRQTNPDNIFSIHPLFRETLLLRFRQKFSIKEQNRLRYEATQYLIYDGNGVESPELFDAGLPHRVLLEKTHLIEDYIKDMPHAEIEKDPWLLYWSGMSEIHYEPNKAFTRLNKAYIRFRKSKVLDGQWICWSGMVESCFSGFTTDRDIDFVMHELDRLMKAYKKSSSIEVKTRFVSAAIKIMLFRQPQHKLLPFFVQQSIGLFEKIKDVDQKIETGFNLLLMNAIDAEVSLGNGFLEQLKSQIDGNEMLSSSKVLISTIDAIYGWLMADETRWKKGFQSGMELLEKSDSIPLHFHLNAIGIFGFLSFNQMDSSEELVTRINSWSSDPINMCQAQFTLALMEMQKNNTDSSIVYTKQAISYAQQSGTQIYVHLAKMLLSYLLLNQGKLIEGNNILVNIEHEVQDSAVLRLQHMILQAYYHIKFDDKSMGLSLLQDAFTLSEQKGIYNFPIWCVEMMTELCVFALNHSSNENYVQKLIVLHRLFPLRPPLELANWPWKIKIFTLGRFGMQVDGSTIKFSSRGSNKLLELIKAIVAYGGREVSEGVLCDALWPDAEAESAYTAFTTTLHRLRKLIGCDDAIKLQGRKVTLNDKVCWVDSWSLQRLCGRVDESYQRNKPIEEPEVLAQKMFSLYNGPFLKNENAVWALSIRERLRSLFIRNIKRLALNYENDNNYEQAIECYQRVLDINPLAEDCYQGIMLCFQRMDRRAEALEVYQRCKELFGRILEVEPSDKTKQIRNSLLERN